MKTSTFRTYALVGLLAIAPFGAFAQSQIDAYLGYYGTDFSGVYANDQVQATYGQTAKYAPSLNAGARYTYSWKIDDANAIKFALLYDAWLGLYTGSTSTQTGAAGQNAGNVQPSVQWTGFGFDVIAAFPLYYANPANASGVNTLRYAYTPTAYLPVSTASYPVSTYSSWVTNYTKAVYKYSFDKTVWVSIGCELDYGLTPTVWLADVKPMVSLAYGPAVLDTKFSYFSKYTDNESSKYFDTFFEPKLTYDFASLGVAGLKAYVGSKISLSTSSATYNTPTKTYAFRNTSLTPGATYKLGFGSAGDATFEVAAKFNRIDNDKSSNAVDVAPFAELQFKAGYSVKF